MKPKLRTILDQTRIDKVPPGWLTYDKMGAEQGYASPESFRFVLRPALARGLVECKKFRVMTKSGIRALPHYRYTKKALR